VAALRVSFRHALRTCSAFRWPGREGACETKKAASAAFPSNRAPGYAENDDPQPQVEVAFGFLITNCSPCMPDW